MSIYVNQLGYLPTGSKQATISESTSYKLMNSKGEEVMSGEATLSFDELSGENVGLIDFSNITEEGEYYFVDSTGVESCKFSVSSNLYNDLLRDSVKMLYFQRCGMELEEKYAGPYTHKACHIDKVSLLTNPEKKCYCTGGWHDAGDYGRYTTPAATTIAHLLYAYEMTDALKTLETNIPETGNGMPDVLNESKWELDWMLKMQNAEGAVYHKLTSMHHTSFVMPEDDPLPFVITPVSSLATAAFAGAMALAYRVYKPFNAEYAETLKAAALKAGQWLLDNPDYLFKNPSDVHTGTYSDPSDLDERLWAYAELYRLTQDNAYMGKINEILNMAISLTSLGWMDIGGFASLAIITAPEGIFSKAIVNKAANAFINEADKLIKVAGLNPFSLANYSYELVWGSNLVVLANGIIACIAHSLTKDKKYLDLAISQVDYVLGRNAMNFSYVSGYGTYSLNEPHNRPTVADGIEKAIPGFVSGGPNYRPGDPKAKEMIAPGAPAMKCYVDDWMSYSTNEITIYWNSPLVYVVSYLMKEVR